MKYLFDTSILVAAVLSGHQQHHLAKPWLVKAIKGKLEMFVCNHTLAELYAVLTKLPYTPKIQPSNALMLIEHNVIKVGSMVNLTTRDYHHVLQEMSQDHLSRGLTYDRLIYRAAIKSGANKILTLNKKDFDRFNGTNSVTIISP